MWVRVPEGYAVLVVPVEPIGEATGEGINSDSVADRSR